MTKKIKLFGLSMLIVSASAFAGSVPEFDVVGSDHQNYFNDKVRDSVVMNNTNFANVKVNEFGDFPGEGFATTASGPIDPSFCFPGYVDYLAGATNNNTFHWDIVLQMKPESDLDLMIRDCVMKHNSFDIWEEAGQTGRFRNSAGVLKWRKKRNPTISAKACPGPKNTALGNTGCFYFDARSMPTLKVVPLFEQLYTSKALWAEGLVLVMPEDGKSNKRGEETYRLREGDIISVWVKIPNTSPVDIFYGKDNVSIKYIGEKGTWLLGNP